MRAMRLAVEFCLKSPKHHDPLALDFQPSKRRESEMTHFTSPRARLHQGAHKREVGKGPKTVVT